MTIAKKLGQHKGPICPRSASFDWAEQRETFGRLRLQRMRKKKKVTRALFSTTNRKKVRCLSFYCTANGRKDCRLQSRGRRFKTNKISVFTILNDDNGPTLMKNGGSYTLQIASFHNFM